LSIEELHGTCGHHGLLALRLCIRSREHRVAGHPILGELAGHRKTQTEFSVHLQIIIA
jgi:hypothetical protein